MMQKDGPDRYIRWMVDYNEQPRAAGYEVIGDEEDLYIIVEDGVKIEKDKNYNLDDVSIYLGADSIKCISLVEMYIR